MENAISLTLPARKTTLACVAFGSKGVVIFMSATRIVIVMTIARIVLFNLVDW